MAAFRATYRLQLTADFAFDDARELIPYLRDLGISHLYLSPVTQARSGSRHGYDVVDPTHVSAELGGEDAFRALAADARKAGLGLLLDVVPNHMATDDANPYWTDPTLRQRFFDIDPVTGEHRRFFDVTDLAGVRQEDSAVFEETHRLVLSFVREGLADGLRIDHPDGLADPAAYLQRLREQGVEHVWVEKILDPGERLRDWPVEGTVGYEFLDDVCALFVDRSAEHELTALWQRISGDQRPFGEVALEAKLQQVQTTFSPEVGWLERELGFALDSGRTALEHALASLPIYRTYVRAVPRVVAEEDRYAIAESAMDGEIAELLLLSRPAPAAFVTRFQQTTPAVMAKGVEDTALYRYDRLLALNDVGGDPSRFGISVHRFHAGNLDRAARFPRGLLSTQTHDTKRSGDVRARIGQLAAMPAEWSAQVQRWLELTQPLRDGGAPDDVERYFIFQTLLGAWPIDLDRLLEYIQKALREAKRNTTWIAQNAAWEAAVAQFCRSLLTYQPFLTEFVPFAARVALLGDRVALRQVVLKLTSPGVPDIYQGDELLYLALVDPDNRRPVDWETRKLLLAGLLAGQEPGAGTTKLFVTQRLLALRARRPDAFTGAYEPIAVGERACAFVRGGQVLVIVEVLEGGAADVLSAPAGFWRDVLRDEDRSFDGGQVPLGALLDEYGIAVLERVGG